MQLTRFKSRQELALALQGKTRVAVFACTLCANFSGTGGHTGIRYMKGVLRELGKETVVSRCITGCCLESVVRVAFDRALPPVANRCDAVVMLSCSSGVKTAWALSPGIPVVAACDTLGSRPVSSRDDSIHNTLCSGCGRCVITYTRGICPRHTCPNSLYGPCAAAPLDREDNACVAFPGNDCVWKEIIARGGDLEALACLKSMAPQAGSTPVLEVNPTGRRPVFARFLAQVLARTSGMVSRIVPLLK